MSLIIAQSRLSAAETHCRVRFDIMQRGWIPTDGEEEQSFDLIVDMGVKSDKREFQTSCPLGSCHILETYHLQDSFQIRVQEDF